MPKILEVYLNEPLLVVAIAICTAMSLIILSSVANFLFPSYFLYILLGVIIFIIFSQLDTEILLAFTPYLYVLSILFLLLPLALGQVTRGVVRWIVIGGLTIQPAEIVRPFLLLFLAKYLTDVEMNPKRVIKAGILAFIPLILILIQPSLGVAVLTFVGFVGLMFSLKFNKRLLIAGMVAVLTMMPVFWVFMAPYQRVRVETLFNPGSDPTGVGYNSIQAKISVGSGKFFGRGLGKGVQTQLLFLPEKHTDFVFASASEELGFLGASTIILASSMLLYRIISILEFTRNPALRAFVSAAFLSLFAQTVVHVGMNMGLFPITGLPLPLISAGGSSYLATMLTLGIIINSKKPKTGRSLY